MTTVVRNPLDLGQRFARFIIVVRDPCTAGNLERWGVSWLTARGKEVHLLDLSLLVWGRERRAPGEPEETLADAVRARDWRTAVDFISERGPGALLILYVEPSPTLRRLCATITRNGLATLYLDRGRQPTGPYRFRSFRNATWPLEARVRDWWRAATDPTKFDLDYFVMSGTDCERHPPSWLRSARVRIPAHTDDYGLWRGATPFDNGGRPYAVFLDQAFPEHADLGTVLPNNPFQGDIYYGQVQHLLDRVREAYGLSVLVALHPRASTLDGKKARYPGLGVFHGRTAALVKSASLVIAHDSTAVSFAVLGRRPLLLVKVDERDHTFGRGILRNLAAALDVPVVHIGARRLPAFAAIRVDESKYAAYEARYIRHPSSRSDGDVWYHLFGSDEKS